MFPRIYVANTVTEAGFLISVESFVILRQSECLFFAIALAGSPNINDLRHNIKVAQEGVDWIMVPVVL